MKKTLLFVVLLSQLIIGCEKGNTNVTLEVDYATVLKEFMRPSDPRGETVLALAIEQKERTGKSVMETFFVAAKNKYPNVPFRMYFKWDDDIRPGVGDKEVKTIIEKRCNQRLDAFIAEISSYENNKFKVFSVNKLEDGKLNVNVTTKLSKQEIQKLFKASVQLNFYEVMDARHVPQLIDRKREAIDASGNVEESNMDTMNLDEGFVVVDRMGESINIEPVASFWGNCNFSLGGQIIYTSDAMQQAFLDSLNQEPYNLKGMLEFFPASKKLNPEDAKRIYPCIVNSEESVVLKESDIEFVSIEFAQGIGEFVMSMEMTELGEEKFAQMSTENVGRSIAIVSNGEVISAPFVNEPIRGGIVQISGGFSEKEAKDLASLLNGESWSMPSKVLKVDD